MLNYILYTNAKLFKKGFRCMINALSATRQKEGCITSFLNAPMHKSFGKRSSLGGKNVKCVKIFGI